MQLQMELVAVPPFPRVISPSPQSQLGKSLKSSTHIFKAGLRFPPERTGITEFYELTSHGTAHFMSRRVPKNSLPSRPRSSGRGGIKKF